MKKLTKKLLQQLEDGSANKYFICRDYILSESFIRENQDKLQLYWNAICHYQDLSEDFVIEFEDKISWLNLLYNKYTNRYSEKTQKKILHNSMNEGLDLEYSIPYMTDYMRKEYEKLRMMF
jgi:hypothetical protein